MVGKIALILRTLFLYPLAGFLGAWVGFVSWNAETGILIVDLDGASLIVAGVVWASVAGGTFGLSRAAKAIGWAT